MASDTIFLILFISITPGIIFGQVTTTSTPSTTPSWTNPFADAKSGNPGANARVSDKAIDAFHVNAADHIAGLIRNISLANFDVFTGFGTLTIKPPQIADVKLPNSENRLIQPNRMESRFYGIGLTADGGWQYKAGGLSRRSMMSGTYCATVRDGELETTSQFGRTFDYKPMVQTADCKANFSQFRVDIQGAANLSVIENCNNPICNKIRSFFEDAICQVLRTFVKEYVNRHLATFPTRVNIDDQQKINYNVLNGGPKVSSDQHHIDTGLEGKFMWRNMDSVPFNAPDRSWTNKSRMFSFEMTDYTFNTLFHQAHSQGHRFSAADLISKTPDMQQLLTLNCTAPSNTPAVVGRRKPNRYRVVTGRSQGQMCLGSLLDNDTNAGPFSSSDSGDLVYKTGQKAATVYVQSNGHAFVDGGLGNLEIYGPASNDTLGRRQRPLLARFDVRMIRGDFFPKWNGANITGTIKFSRIHLEKSAPAPPSTRSLSDEWLQKFHHVALPLLTESFNAFLNKYAQFPIPMLASLQCTSPEFFVSARTMQVDCDLARRTRTTVNLGAGNAGK